MIIGIAGKIGSGKSHIGKYIAEQTGFRLIKLDYQAGQVANTFLIKQSLQKKIKRKIPKPYEDMQLFPLLKNLNEDFNKFSISVFIYLLNKKLNKIIKDARKKNENILVDFLSLPLLKSVKHFDAVYLVKSDDEKRFEYLGARDGMTPEEAENQEKYLVPYYAKNEDYPFDDIIFNDYQNVPDNVERIIEKLKDVDF